MCFDTRSFDLLICMNNVLKEHPWTCPAVSSSRVLCYVRIESACSLFVYTASPSSLTQRALLFAFIKSSSWDWWRQNRGDTWTKARTDANSASGWDRMYSNSVSARVQCLLAACSTHIVYWIGRNEVDSVVLEFWTTHILVYIYIGDSPYYLRLWSMSETFFWKFTEIFEDSAASNFKTSGDVSRWWRYFGWSIVASSMKSFRQGSSARSRNLGPL